MKDAATFTSTKAVTPDASPAYREQLAAMLKARLDDNRRVAIAALLSKRDFAPTDPNREDTAKAIVDIVLGALTKFVIILFCLLASALGGWTSAYAYAPVSESPRIVSTCDARHALAGAIGAEGGAQPYETQLAIAQIIVREAESRDMSVCSLIENTHFVSVWHYAQAHPQSWTARQLAYPHEEWYSVADDALLHVSPLVAPGMGHWNGDGMHILFRP